MNSRIEAKPTPSSLSRPLVQERLRPLARTPFYAARGVEARILRVWLKPARHTRAPSFVVSCGRSATTLLGELMAAHPEVRYLHEPCHFWAAVEPTTNSSSCIRAANIIVCLMEAQSRLRRGADSAVS